MDLSTGIIITLPRVYPCVMTKIVIKSVEKIAELQGFKTLHFLIAVKSKLFFLMLICSQDWTGYTMTMKQMIYKRMRIKNISITIKLI